MWRVVDRADGVGDAVLEHDDGHAPWHQYPFFLSHLSPLKMNDPLEISRIAVSF